VLNSPIRISKSMVLSNSKFPLIFIQSLLVSFLFSCGNGDEKTDVKETDLLSQRAAFEIASVPLPIASGDSILFSALVADSSLKFDSVVVKIDDQRILSWKEKPGSFLWPSANMGMGKHVFRLAGFYKGNENGSGSMIFSIASNIIPEEFGFEIVKTMAHNPSSFTQGLEWQSDKLFEGTGLNGKSVVMQINPSNGDALKKVNLDKEFFGEGITILNNKLYQLTWQSHKGFVYSLPDLKLESEFGYPTEGWGICNLNGNLVMGDGSEKLYFLNSKDFHLEKSLEVWDRKYPVSELNELEAVEGVVYANKYQTDTIVKIDPANGKVLAYINMAGLLKKEDRLGNEDVLNGIAWNPSDKLYYLTGKNWPKMFAVRFVRKKVS